MDARDMDDIYRTVPLKEIPWIHDGPSQGLVDLVEGKMADRRMVDGGRSLGWKVKPCRTVVLGCGIGTNAIYLAERGFEVTGIDISSKAIELARKKAKQRGMDCTFVSADILGELKGVVGGGFEFALSWQVMHHIFPKHREEFVKQVRDLLVPGGKFLSVCFSEENRNFGGVGEGKVRRSSLGTDLYFSSEDELRELFRKDFRIIDLRTMEISGKPVPHAVILVFMKKR